MLLFKRDTDSVQLLMTPPENDRTTDVTTTTLEHEIPKNPFGVPDVPVKYRMYPARWLVLSVCCFLALSNAMQWLAYSSLNFETAIFYCEDPAPDRCSMAFWSNQIFQFVGVVLGLAGMYLTDYQGIKASSFFGVSFNLAGSILRLLSSLPSIESKLVRLVLVHTGSVVAASAGAVFLVLPGKIAECWFVEDQRTLANVLSFLANPLGVVLGTLVPQFIFNGKVSTDDSWGLFYWNVVMVALAAVPFVLALFVKNSVPPTPPSLSNQNHHVHAPSFHEGLILCVKNRKFMVQAFTFGMGFGLLWACLVHLPQILDIRKYHLEGNHTALCAFVGVISSIAAGYIADHTKAFKEIVKISSVLFFVGALATRIYLEHERQHDYDTILMLVFGSILGLSSIPLFPIGVEMGVETTYPVYEATSSGLLVISAQLVLCVLSQILDGALSSSWIYENIESLNWRFALDIWVVLCGVYMLCCLLVLNPSYRRCEFDHTNESKGDIKKEETTH